MFLFCSNLLCTISTLVQENPQWVVCLRPRHKLYKSADDRWIFAGCLFWGIGSSSADFRDLERCHKIIQQAPHGVRWETVRAPSDSLWKCQHFRPIPRRRPDDDRPATHRRLPGCRPIAVGRQGILRSSVGHRSVTVRSSAGHRMVLRLLKMGNDFKFHMSYH